MSTTIHHQHQSPIRYVCPEWCVDAETDRHDSPKAYTQLDDPNAIDVHVGHDGPTFGSWSCTAEQNIMTGQLVPDVTFDSVRNTFKDPAERRQHIADAQAALARLEATL